MANLTITAANVIPTADSIPGFGVAGEAITAGQPIYLRTSDQKWIRGESGDTQAKAESVAIAITSAVSGGQVGYVSGGSLSVGAILTVKTLYVLSATTGLICPIADLVATDWVTLIGVPKSTSVLQLTLLPLRYQIA